MKIKNLSRWFFNVLFPKYCLGCGDCGEAVCVRCLQRMRFAKQVCARCRRQSSGGRFCLWCSGGFELDRLLVGMEYEGLIRDMVARFKYCGVKEYLPILGEVLRTVMFFERLEGVLVPIPSQTGRVRERGFSQVEMLVRYLALHTGMPWMEALEVKVPYQRQQELGRSERLENLREKFGLRAGVDLEGLDVILVDDVATTCSTLNEGTRALRRARPRSITGLVVARGK